MPTAHIRPHNGAPTLFINGKPAPALTYMTFHLQEQFVRQFAEVGMPIYQFITTGDYDYYRMSAEAWIGPGQYDYTQFDQRMEMILRAAPNAMILPRLYVCTPAWWDDAHPDELMVGKDGVYGPKPNFGWIQSDRSEASMRPQKMTVPSFSSKLWLKDGGEALANFIRHAEEKFGDRTIGYHLTSGGSQEWYYWGGFEDTFADFSRPQQEAFGAYLRKLGRRDISDRPVPSARERLATEAGTFRDPSNPAAQRVIDYWRFHCEALLDCLKHFAAVIRGGIGRDKIIGTFYGYFVDLQRHATCWHNSGHLAIQSLLRDPNIDFIASPTTYKDRSMGGGYSLYNSVTQSIHHHGKLWWNENDILTTNSPDLKDRLFYVPKSQTESRHLQRREFANAICQGAGAWWFDMWGRYYDDPETMGDIRRMVEIAQRSVEFDRSSVAEVAVVLDDESIFYTGCNNRLTVPLISEQLIELGHLGAPFDTIHVNDIADWPQRKLYIFLDLFYCDDARMEKVRRVIGRPGTTALFVYAPGLVGDRVDAGRMEKLTGIKLGMDMSPAPLRIVRSSSFSLLPPDKPKLELRTKAEYGTTEPIAPVTYANDPAAEVLGHLAGSDRAGLVRKAIGGATSIFSSAPNLPADLLRDIAASAGVHLYTDAGQTVYANGSFLAVAAMAGQAVTLRLPKDGTLYELFERKEMQVKGATNLPSSADGTWLFFRGSEAQFGGRTR